MTFRLDISAKNLDSLLSTGNHLDPVKVGSFMQSLVLLREKIDGLKITAWRNSEPYGKFNNNWIVAYKNFVLFESELENFGPEHEGMDFCQFREVLKALKEFHYTVGFYVPTETEFFFEFATTKPTLMQKYDRSALFILNWSISDGEVVGGYLQTSPTTIGKVDWLTERPEWPKSILVPPVLFKGTPKDLVSTQGDAIQQYTEFKQKLLETPSCIGPKIEGVIGSLESDFPGNFEGMFKIQQPEQNDPIARQKLRAANRCKDPNKEQAYWSQVNVCLDDLLKLQDARLEDQLYQLQGIVGEISRNWKIYKEKYQLDHDVKGKPQILNDLYVTARLRILKSRPENQNGLIVGRFQPLTVAHADMIRKAAQKHNIVWVAVVDGAHTSAVREMNPLTYTERKVLIEALDIHNVRVFRVPTGSVKNIVASIPSGVSTLYCGTDRLAQYKLAVKNMNVDVVEVPRTSISGTQLRAAIRSNDRTAFQNLVDPKLHPFYERLRDWL